MAAANGTALDLCATLVVTLDDPKKALPANYVQASGFYQALKSPENRAGYEFELAAIRKNLADKDAPISRTQFKYIKPVCDDQTHTTPTSPCTPVSVGSDLYGYVDITIDGYNERKFTVTRAQFRAACYDKDSYVAMSLRETAKGLLRDVNKQLKTKVTALMGNYSDGVSSIVTPVSLPLFNTTGGINASGTTYMDTEYALIGAVDGITIVGGIDLRKYNNALGVAATNSMNGTNAALLSPMPFYYDTTVAKDEMFTWQNTAIQLIEAYKYDGVDKEYSEKMVRMVMPIDGVEYDLTIAYDECSNGGSWTFTLSKNFALAYIPTADFTCYPTSGMNGKQKYLVGCGDMDCAALGL